MKKTQRTGMRTAQRAKATSISSASYQRRRSRSARYRASKYTPNVYDISVLTGFVILVISVTFVSLEQPADQALAGQAAVIGGLYCVAGSSDIVCSSAAESVKADSFLAGCLGKYGCVLACADLGKACKDGSAASCALQNKFC